MKRTAWLRSPVVLYIIIGIFAFFFAFAGASKLLEIDTFYGQLSSQPLPDGWTPLLVWLIPVGLILVAIGLLFELTRLAALCAALALFGCFALYIIFILSNTFHRIPCSCAAVFRSWGWKEHLYFNLVMLMLAAWAISLQRKREVFKSPY